MAPRCCCAPQHPCTAATWTPQRWVVWVVLHQHHLQLVVVVLSMMLLSQHCQALRDQTGVQGRLQVLQASAADVATGLMALAHHSTATMPAPAVVMAPAAGCVPNQPLWVAAAWGWQVRPLHHTSPYLLP